MCVHPPIDIQQTTNTHPAPVLTLHRTYTWGDTRCQLCAHKLRGRNAIACANCSRYAVCGKRQQFFSYCSTSKSQLRFLTCKNVVRLKRKHHLLCVHVRTCCCCCSIHRTPSAGTDFVIFVFLPQRAPFAPLWPLRAPT